MGRETLVVRSREERTVGHRSLFSVLESLEQRGLVKTENRFTDDGGTEQGYALTENGALRLAQERAHHR